MVFLRLLEGQCASRGPVNLQLVFKGIQGKRRVGRGRPDALRIPKQAQTSGREPEGDMVFLQLLEGQCTSRGPVQLQESRDVTADGGTPLQWILVSIKWSKTDQFRKGLVVPRCKPCCLLKYMARQGNEEDPLFRFRNDHPLTRARLDGALKKALQGVGSAAADFPTYSLI